MFWKIYHIHREDHFEMGDQQMSETNQTKKAISIAWLWEPQINSAPQHPRKKQHWTNCPGQGQVFKEKIFSGTCTAFPIALKE